TIEGKRIYKKNETSTRKKKLLHGKYPQHRLRGTLAAHDHTNVGVRSKAAATSSQSPSRCKGMSGVPLTSDITGGPFGATRTLSPSAGTFTTPMEQRGGSAHIVYGP